MSTYSYPQSAAIDQVTFKKTANGAVRAYLHASAGADGATIKSVLDTLKGLGFECVPFTFEGKDMLEVRGFGREEKMLSLLDGKQFIAGKADIRLDTEDKPTWLEKFKKRTLQLSGLSYLVGDYGLWTYGHGEKNKLIKASSLFYFLGTLSLVFYGRNDQSDLQVHDLAKSLEGFLANEKIALPDGSAMHSIAQDKEKNPVQSLHEFGKRYPSEIFNSVTAVAGLFMALAAYKKIKLKPTAGMDATAISANLHEGWMDFGLGSLTLGSGIFGTVVKEKKHDPDAPPAKGLSWLWEKMREHPLAVTGIGYTISTLCHAGSTWKAWGEARRTGDTERLKSVPRRGLFVGMAFLSEFLLAISSKGHGEGVVNDTSVDNSVIAIAAEVIARQPEEMKEALVQQIGTFLGAQKSLAMKDNEVIEALRRQVDIVRSNPWIKAATSAQAREEVPLAVETKPAQPENPLWQTRMALRQTEVVQPAV